jgi:hypothetical protein
LVPKKCPRSPVQIGTETAFVAKTGKQHSSEEAWTLFAKTCHFGDFPQSPKPRATQIMEFLGFCSNYWILQLALGSRDKGWEGHKPLV